MARIVTYGNVFEDPKGKIDRNGSREHIFRETVVVEDGTKYHTFHRFWTKEEANKARERMAA